MRQTCLPQTSAVFLTSSDLCKAETCLEELVKQGQFYVAALKALEPKAVETSKNSPPNVKKRTNGTSINLFGICPREFVPFSCARQMGKQKQEVVKTWFTEDGVVDVEVDVVVDDY
eukprot:6451049-Amphidinium_carterae.1